MQVNSAVMTTTSRTGRSRTSTTSSGSAADIPVREHLGHRRIRSQRLPPPRRRTARSSASTTEAGSGQEECTSCSTGRRPSKSTARRSTRRQEHSSRRGPIAANRPERRSLAGRRATPGAAYQGVDWGDVGEHREPRPVTAISGTADALECGRSLPLEHLPSGPRLRRTRVRSACGRLRRRDVATGTPVRHGSRGRLRDDDSGRRDRPHRGGSSPQHVLATS